MSLFNSGQFRLHSGSVSSFKIDCDALTEDDWKAIAAIVGQHTKFGQVIGVPSGGLRLAEALAPYCTSGPTLIVDDVLTTGASMREVAEGLGAMHPYTGFVLFARGPCPSWVWPLFVMSEPKP